MGAYESAPHFFEHGAVAERLRGKLAVFRYADVSPRFVVWDEPMDDSIRKRVQLWSTMPECDYQLCLDGMKKADRAALKTIAVALGLSPEPEPIGRWGLPAAARALDNAPLPARQLW